MFDLSQRETALFQKCSTPEYIQDYLDTLPFNFEKKGPTNFSPASVIREHKAHCFEAACFAAATLWYHGQAPLLLDLRSLHHDFDHVVTLFQRNGFWGAISKTNHGVLRYRDPIYRTVRELALSYFHEYFLTTTGEKTLREYSRPFNVKRCGTEWITSEHDIDAIAETLDQFQHYPFIPKGQARILRPASALEKKMSALSEWRRTDRGT